MKDWTDYSPPSSSNNATVLCGYLRRSGRTGKTLGLRQKRFYKLDGAIFSKHSSEGSGAIWDINVQGAQIGRLGRTNFGIRLQNLEKRAARDFHNNLIVLYARTEEECNVWVSALRNASQRKLEDYYEVLDIIGEGGFAKVRLGRCLTSNEKRAIKTMSKAEAHAKVLGTEVAIIKRVDHPNIVKTFDIFETVNQIHIVMEYMEGGMLYDAIEDGVKFDEADVVQFMRELLDGMLYLHDLGIVHRDIKPENVLCTSRKTPLHVKIADFGLSSISTVADMKANRMLMSTMIGTPEFVAPEIARQETYTEKVDMWALGMLCYNVIARRLPLDESRDMILQIQEGITLTFPEPEWETYSPKAKSFVRSLVCTEAEKRLSPLGCLVHPWLEQITPEQSTKFAAHGRMSNILFAPNARQNAIMQRHRDLNVKKIWRKVYLSVNALCKLTTCCGALKLFGTARLRAISMLVDRRMILGVVGSNDSSSTRTFAMGENGTDGEVSSGNMRYLGSIATSNSTTPGGGASRKGSEVDGDDGRRNAAARMAREISCVGLGKEVRVPSVYQLGGSGDMDFGFEDAEIADSEFDGPQSLTFEEGMPAETSSRALLRLAAFGRKVRGATGSDGPKTDVTELRAIRKLGNAFAKKGAARAQGNTEQKGTIGVESRTNNVEETSGLGVVPNSASWAILPPSVPPAGLPSSSSTCLGGVNSCVVGPDRKISLRQRIINTLNGEGSKPGSGLRVPASQGRAREPAQPPGAGAMSKLTKKILRKQGEAGRSGGALDGRSMTVAGLTADPDNVSDRILAMDDLTLAEPDDHYRFGNDGVRTFDVAHFQQMYGEESSKSSLMKYLLRSKGSAGSATHDGAPNDSGKAGRKPRKDGREMAGKLSPLCNEDAIINQMSPLTPGSAADSRKRFAFRK